MHVSRHPAPPCKPVWEVASAAAQELQKAMNALRGEQATQSKAIGGFAAQLAAADIKLQSCVGAVAVLSEEHTAADARLHSMRTVVTEHQAHLTELAAECDRRHETAMKMQQTMATETALLTQQVSPVVRQQKVGVCIVPSRSEFPVHSGRTRYTAAQCCCVHRGASCGL